MGLNTGDFSSIVVRVLNEVFAPEVPHTANAYSIVLETCYHESDGLTYLYQVGGGPGRGVGQIEGPTFNDLTRRYLPSRQPKVWSRFAVLSPHWPSIPLDEVVGNLYLAVALVRARYLMDTHGIPNTIEARAAYWGRVYQTSNDPVKMQQYVDHAKEMYA